MRFGISWNHRDDYSTEAGRGLLRGGIGVRETRDWRERRDKRDQKTWVLSAEFWVLSSELYDLRSSAFGLQTLAIEPRTFLPFQTQNSAHRTQTGFISLVARFTQVSQVAHTCRRMAVLEKLLRTSQLKIEDVQAAWTAFRVYQKGKADFTDCLMGTTNRLEGCETTVTLNQAASKPEGFRVI